MSGVKRISVRGEVRFAPENSGHCPRHARPVNMGDAEKHCEEATLQQRTFHCADIHARQQQQGSSRTMSSESTGRKPCFGASESNTATPASPLNVA